MILFIAIFVALIQAKLGKETDQDGVFASLNVNRYLKLSQNSGFKFEGIPHLEPKTGTEFSLLVWFMLDKYPWESPRSDMTILEIENKFKCMIYSDKTLDCISGTRSSDFQIKLDEQLIIDQWYLLVLTSTDGKSQLKVYDQSFNDGPLYEQSSRYFDPFYVKSSRIPITNIDLYVGLNYKETSDGFKGYLRQLQIFGKYLDSEQLIKNAAFTFLIEEDSLYFQSTFFNSTIGLIDSVSKIQGQQIGRYVSRGVITPVMDFQSQFFCQKLSSDQFPEYINFNSSVYFQRYDMNSRIYSDRDENGDYQVTLYAWVQISNHDKEMILFDHNEIQRLTIKDSILEVYHNRDKNSKILVNVPSNKWLWLVSWHDFDGFGIHLEDLNGNIYRNGSIKVATATSFATNSRVQIAQDFIGSIQGMKYYKGLPTSFSPQSFTPVDDPSPSGIFYFRFSPDGFFNNDLSQLRLSNMISDRSRFSSYALDGRFDESSLPLQNILTKNIGEIYKYSSLKWDTKWDGISCKDEQKRLYFKKNGVARARIWSGKEEYEDITVEFWFKTLSRNVGQRSLITILKNGSPVFTVMKDQDGFFRCHPYYETRGTIKEYSITYFDFNLAPSWYHISCTIDSQNYIWGTIFRQNNDGSFVENAYINHIEKQNFTISKTDRFDIVLNGDRQFENGMEETYFADVRVWKTARTWHQIKEQRNQVIDFNTEKNLLTAFQLLGGGIQELDMASIQPLDFIKDQSGTNIFSNKLSLQNAEWRPSTSLFLMCPLLTYVSYKDKKCYRDGLIELDFVVRKDTKWRIETKYSHFVDEDLRKDYQQKYTFYWTIEGMIPNDQKFPQIIEPHLNNHELQFDFDEISQDGTYFLKLEVRDDYQRQQETVSKSLRFEPQSCVKFYDYESGLTFVEIDTGKEKGSEDIYFKFYTEANCDNIYQIDQVVYNFDFLDYKPPTGVSIQGDKLIINQQAQTFLPVDTDIIIILRASWFSRLDYSIVYCLRFNSRVNLQVSASTQIVPLGETLQLFTNRTTIINYSGRESGSQWQVEWSCPSSLCPNNFEKSLSIPHSSFTSSGLSYWQRYNISANGTSYFIQGDGTLSSFSSIDVIWIPFKPDAKILGEDYISVDQILALEIDTNGIAQDKVKFKWTVYPQVDPKYYFNGDGKKEFFIEPNRLKENTNYQFTVEIILIENDLAFWQGKKFVYLNPTPADGKIVINPYKGVAMETEFEMETFDWIVRHEPAEYQFMYQNSNGEYSVITPYSSSTSFKTYLPPTKKLIVKVRDAKGFIMTGSTTIFSQFQNETKTLESHKDEFSIALQNNDLTKLSLLSNNFNKFSSFQGFYLSRLQSDQLITYFEQLQSVNDFTIQSAISILCTITYSENLYDEDSAIRMQQVLLRYLEPIQRRRQLQAIFTNDLTMQQSVVKMQSNLLQKISNDIEREQTLINGFKDVKIANITQNLREIIIKLEKYISQQNAKIQISSENVRLFTFAENITELALASDEKGTIVYFGINPFLGSWYMDDAKVIQNIDSNQTAYVLGSTNVTFDYFYEKDKFDKDFELEITNCLQMNSSDLVFNHCQTTHFYSDNKISCSCEAIGSYFLTVGKDEFIQPLSEAQGNFDFKNWASFVMFTYLMLLFIFGMILSQNKDQQDIAKMNDFEQGQGIETTEIQFPLSALALKRQVQIMNFTHSELTYGTLFLLYLTQFHPFLTFKYRFDPNLSRQDRFLILFAKITIITFGSFIWFRNLDLEIKGTYNFPRDKLFWPFIFIPIFSLLILPLPRFISRLFEKKYLLTELPDNFDETGQFFGGGGGNDETAIIDPANPAEQNSMDHLDGAAPKDHSLLVNPNIPLKYLFQLSAFSLVYLKKKGEKRFPFLTKGLSEIGEMLEQPPQAMEVIKPKEEEPKKKDKKRRSRRRQQLQEEEKIQFQEDAEASEGFSPHKPIADNTVRAPLTNETMMEGGSDSSDGDEEPLNKEFVEENSNGKVRLLLYVLIAAMQISLLAIYSLESVHSRGGQYIWVVVAFSSQILGFFVTHVLHIALVTFIVFKNQEDKTFLCKHFYDQLIILEDYFYVQKFQNKF